MIRVEQQQEVKEFFDEASIVTQSVFVEIPQTGENWIVVEHDDVEISLSLENWQKLIKLSANVIREAKLQKREQKPRRCYNCKFAGKQFKVGKVSHLHCQDEKQHPKEKLYGGELTAWDTLQKFSDTCEFHEFKY